MKKLLHFLLFVFFFLAFAYAEGNPTKIVESNTEIFQLKFELGEYKLNYHTGYTFIDADYLTHNGEEGEAMLPVYILTVGIPTEGKFSFSTSNLKIAKTPLKYPVAPFPKIIQEKEKETYHEIYEIKPDIYNKSLQPKLIEASNPYLWRNQRVVRFVIHPFRVENNRLIITSQVELRINFLGKGNIKRNFNDANFEKIFRNTIVNFNIAKYWSVERIKRNKQFSPFSHAHRWFKMLITQDGIYKITKSQLADAGIDVDNLQPKQIKIFNGSGLALKTNVNQTTPDLKEIPIFLSQAGDDFSIYFYARNTDGFEMNETYNQYFNPYAPANIYWLTYNYNDSDIIKKSNKRVTPHFNAKINRDTLTTYHYIEHYEKEEFRIKVKGIYWYWYNFSGGGTSSYSFEFPVSNLVHNENQNIRLKFNNTPNSNFTELYLNGNEITNANWGASTITLTGDFLVNGNNTLGIKVLSRGSQTICFDYYEVEYDKYLTMENHKVAFSLPQVNTLYNVEISNAQNNELQIFKVYDFDDVKKIGIDDSNLVNNTVSFTDSISNIDTKYYAVCDGGYLTPSEIIEDNIEDYYVYNNNGMEVSADTFCYLRDANGLANTDMIIISPDDFYEESKELADLHCRADSMTVLVVKLTDVYDEFAWGLPDVVAIRNFLKYALDNYGMESDHKVAYAILVGDGTSDYRKYESITGNKNKIPPFVKSTTASDDYFVCFTTLSYPEMMIGRLPCQTQSQSETAINKTIDYLENPDYGFWRDRIILAADDIFSSHSSTETGHTNSAESCAKSIESNVELTKVYGIAYPFDEFQNKPKAREDIIKAINNGVVIFYYIGHGGYDLLGDEEYFRASRDISKLYNAEKLPFFVAAACAVGQFDSNTFESMAEKMVVAKDKGTIASFAATRGSSGPSNNKLCNPIIDSLVIDAGQIRLGETILLSKIHNGSSSNNKLFVLFGDPAIHLAIPPIAGSLEIPNEQVDSLQARQTAHLEGIISDPDNQYDNVFAIVYDTDYQSTYNYKSKSPQRGSINYIKKGTPIFKGPVSCAQDSLSLNFVVPDDIYGGQNAHILAYAVNRDNTKDILMSYHKQADENNHSLIINGFTNAHQDGQPTINIWLDRKEFKNGDYVSTEPTLFAEISDSNGINITNNPGHMILLTIDDKYEENVTEKFVYNLNSYTDGTLEYQINNIEPNNHRLKLEVFDNFNLPSSKEINFKIKEPEHIAVRNVLNYPNPMKDFTYFTFYLDGDAEVDIEIFTISGKKIKTISDKICQPEYNQVLWDGKDDDGDYPANGVYFYKISLNSKRTNKIYKLIISR